jgi:hypothetical protein
MKFIQKSPPRKFLVGWDSQKITINDCGSLELSPDEQVTLTTPKGAEYDVARKTWGFYATPSLNGRLERFGLRGVLVRNKVRQYFVLLVERGHEPDFEEYIASEQLNVVSWLDSSTALEALDKKVSSL